ncbi:MAG: Molybdenum cofactor biosynthesis protein MoaD [Ktedonobacterales bacterium]|jgi:molybdopterin converting factor subunit 1|nr:MAG: Molybdenum cofactor biosynthesis protein MoaD [Ktedonobacterales bacterium]
MRVSTRYFAALREIAGRDSDILDLAAEADVAAARAVLLARYPAMERIMPRCAVAVNRAYVSGDAPLNDGDELVFIPPVGGG